MIIMESACVCYAVWIDGAKEPLYCVGVDEKDIVAGVYKWSDRIDKMEYIGPAYATQKSAE
jgi:hypothetical protein